MTDREIFLNLGATTCVCGAEKKRRMSLCRRHYFALPPGLRAALYETDGYPNTFRRAIDLLEISAPNEVQHQDTTS